jgi:hypothetical protein
MINQSTIELRGLCASCAGNSAPDDNPRGSVTRQLKPDQAPASYGSARRGRTEWSCAACLLPIRDRGGRSLNQSGAREV